MISERKNYSNLDIVKFICSLLVIVIHTAPLQNISDLANFYTVNVISRVAVPLFYAISVFLFFGKLSWENGKIKGCAENTTQLIRYTKKIFFMYLAWSAVYILLIKVPMWYQSGWWGIHVIKDCLVSVFFVGGYYHLWYLLALTYAVPVLFFLLRLIPIKKFALIAALLWLCECLIYSYAWVGVDKLPLVSFISARMPVLLDTAFRAVPLLAVGAYISASMSGSPKKNLICCVISFLLCAIEASLLYFFSPNDSSFSYLLFTPLMAFFWLCEMVNGKQMNIPKSNQMMLRSMNTDIYCLHPLIMAILTVCKVPGGPMMWFLVTVLSVALSAGIAWAKQRKALERSSKEAIL